MHTILGNGLDKSEELELANKCSHVKVTVIDTDKMSEFLIQQVKTQIEHLKDVPLEISGNKTLALYEKGKKSILFNDDLEGEIGESFNIDVRRASEKKMKDGKEVTSFYIFPIGSFDMSLTDLKRFTKEEKSLSDFMGERLNYNSRIVNNTKTFLAHIKE